MKNIKLSLIKTNPDWLEAIWFEELKEDKVETKVLHCESFSGHKEHIEMLRAKALEFQTDLTEEDEAIIKEISEAYVYPSEEELNALEEERIKAEQKALRKEAMLVGESYELNGTEYMISFTSEDGNGLLQVKSAFELGLDATVMVFENGTKMPIKDSEFLTFSMWFVNKRNSFFGGN